MKSLLLTISIILLGLPLSGKPKLKGPEPNSLLEKAGMVSFVQLIANPEKYHGKEIIVNGYLHNQFEDSAIYYTKELSDRDSTADAFWVGYLEDCSMRPETEKGLNYFDRKWVMLKGRFNMKRSGHFGMYQGTIEKVSMISER